MVPFREQECGSVGHGVDYCFANEQYYDGSVLSDMTTPSGE